MVIKLLFIKISIFLFWKWCKPLLDTKLLDDWINKLSFIYMCMCGRVPACLVWGWCVEVCAEHLGTSVLKNWRIPTTCLFHGIGADAFLECASSCFSVGGCLSLHFGQPCLCETGTPWDCCLHAVQYLSRPQLPPPSEVEEQVVVPPPPPSIGMPFPMNQVLLPPVCVRMVSVVFLCVSVFVCVLFFVCSPDVGI